MEHLPELTIYQRAVLADEGEIFYTSRDWQAKIRAERFQKPVLEYLRSWGEQWPDEGVRFHYILNEQKTGGLLYGFHPLRYECRESSWKVG